MANYGLTDNGFVIKRLDTILDEIHEELSDGFGIDTRISKPSFLDVLVTTFAGQIANLWEVAQDSYYAKYFHTIWWYKKGNGSKDHISSTLYRN